MKPGPEFVARALESPAPVNYRVLALVGVALAAILVLYRDVALEIVSIWERSSTFNHGFLVVPACLYMAWQKRAELARLTARPFWPGLLVVAGSGFGWLVADLAGVAAVGQLALALALIGAIVTVTGLAISRALAFPLAFLLFAVPMGEFLVPWMMDRTADFTVGALRVTGIPVFREGNHFVIPSGSWSVVEACSGIRYLIASLVGGSLFAYLFYRSPWRRAAVMGAAIAVPLVANWVRAYLIVMIGHLSGNKLAVDVDHLIYGWVFFGVVMFLFFWVASWWREDAPAARGDAPRGSTVAADIVAAPRPAALGALVAVVLATVAAAGAWRPVGAAIDARSLADAGRSVNLAEVVAPEGWRPTAESFTDWAPTFARPAAELRQAFESSDGTVALHVAFYRAQRQGSELVSSENHLVRGENSQWLVIGLGPRELPWGDERVIAEADELRGGNLRLRVARWYWIDGRATASDMRAKAWLAWSKIRGHGDDSAAIVVYTAAGNDNDAADRRVERFLRAAGPAIHAVLARADAD